MHLDFGVLRLVLSREPENLFLMVLLVLNIMRDRLELLRAY